MSLLILSAVVGASAAAVLGWLVVVLAMAAVRTTRAQRKRLEELSQSVAAMRVELVAREATEALLHAHISKLRGQNDDLEQFAHIASHDLRAPLRAIGNLAQWVEEDCEGQISADGQAHLTMLRERVTRLERLIRDLLSYSRAGRSEVAIEEVDISVLVAEIVEETDSERLDLHIQSPKDDSGLNFPSTSSILTTAVAPLRQVLANLIGNAVKHTDRSRASVTLQLAQDSQWLYLTISDDGPGIPPKLFPKALTMFQTLNSNPNSNNESESTGMGLALVKRLVESAGGELELRSPISEGRGLSADVRWPIDWPGAPTGQS